MEHPDRYAALFTTPIGTIGVVIEGAFLAELDILPEPLPERAPDTPLAEEVCRQLRAYFDDPHFFFDLPLRARGTDYRQRVWHALQRIPVGTTLSYGGLAKRLGSGARAIGGACRANPIPIVVPCHRVVASSGPGGYSGETAGKQLATKLWLLAHEGAVSASG